MGILDNVLRPHLEAITKFFKTNELQLLSKYESDKIQESDSEKNAKIKRLRLDNDSEKFRQQGNQFFKAQDFNQALFMYTKSVAAAIEGPLASLAYFNRFDPINIIFLVKKLFFIFEQVRSIVSNQVV
jgi:hypothetical protein